MCKVPASASVQTSFLQLYWKPQNRFFWMENVDELFKAFAFSRCHIAHTHLPLSSSETTNQFHPLSWPHNGQNFEQKRLASQMISGELFRLQTIWQLSAPWGQANAYRILISSKVQNFSQSHKYLHLMDSFLTDGVYTWARLVPFLCS